MSVSYVHAWYGYLRRQFTRTRREDRCRTDMDVLNTMLHDWDDE